MILTTHILTGAAIGIKISNPVFAVVLALLSHFTLDALPHKEYSIKNIQARNWQNSLWDFVKVFLDFSMGMTILSYLIFIQLSWTSTKLSLATNDFPYFLLVLGFIAVSPDELTFLHLIFPKNKMLAKIYKLHELTHWHTILKTPLWLKRSVESLIVLVALLVLSQIL